jgi:hypothetical protein
MITTHIFKTDCGFIVEGKFNEENANLICGWEPEIPTKKNTSPERLTQIKEQYTRWRDEIIQQWCNRTGNRVLFIDL